MGFFIFADPLGHVDDFTTEIVIAHFIQVPISGISVWSRFCLSCKAAYHDAFDRSSTNSFGGSSLTFEFGPWYSVYFLLKCTTSVIYAAHVGHSSYSVPPWDCLGKAVFHVSGVPRKCIETDSTFVDNANSSIQRCLQVFNAMIIHCFLNYPMHRDNSMVPLNKVCCPQLVKCCRECGCDIDNTGEGCFSFLFIDVMWKFLFGKSQFSVQCPLFGLISTHRKHEPSSFPGLTCLRGRKTSIRVSSNLISECSLEIICQYNTYQAREVPKR